MIVGLLTLTLSADEPAARRPGLNRDALTVFNGMIGEWRGTGQVRRGSAQGAWRETGEFTWDFTNGSDAVVYKVKSDKNGTLSSRITWNPMLSQFELSTTTTEGVEILSSGKWDKNQIVFTSDVASDKSRYRTTITHINDLRVLVLLEKTSPEGKVFTRIGEIGYTREGTRLAESSTGQRECIVTGGAGTSTVTYKGETYYLCCSGCRQAFDDHPEQIIADYQSRIANRKK